MQIKIKGYSTISVTSFLDYYGENVTQIDTYTIESIPITKSYFVIGTPDMSDSFYIHFINDANPDHDNNELMYYVNSIKVSVDIQGLTTVDQIATAVRAALSAASSGKLSISGSTNEIIVTQLLYGSSRNFIKSDAISYTTGQIGNLILPTGIPFVRIKGFIEEIKLVNTSFSNSEITISEYVPCDFIIPETQIEQIF